MNRQRNSSKKIVVLNIDAENFTPGGEREKSHGNLFHWQQLMSILCKSVTSKISFKVTCEIEEAGKFDDIVIFYKLDEKIQCSLIQAKHRKNISKSLKFEDLKIGRDFRLKTYFDSYVKMKNDDKFEQKYGCEIKELIICTNIDFNNHLKERMEAVHGSIFYKNGFYRVKESLKTEFKRELIVGNDDATCKEFFCKFDAAREEFVRKFGTTPEEFSSKFDAARKEFISKFDTAYEEFFRKFDTAPEEFFRKFDAASEKFFCEFDTAREEFSCKFDTAPEEFFRKLDAAREEFSCKFVTTREEFSSKFNATLEDFFSKLRFAVQQPDKENLKDDIKFIIVKYLEEKHPDDNCISERIETIYVSLLTKIIDFDINPQVRVISEEDYHNWLHEAFRAKENQLSVYNRYNVCVLDARQLQFKSDSLKELEKSVTPNESSVSLVISCADTIFTVQKLVQIFNEQKEKFCLILDEQVVLSTYTVKRDFLSIDPCKYLIVVCKSNEKSEKVFKTVKNIYDKIRDSNLNRRIVLVSNPEVKIENHLSNFFNLTKFEDHVAWNDLDGQTKDQILEKQIVFQGQLVSFKDIDISHVRDSIKDRVLFDIALSDKYEIGKPFYDSKTDDMYFVPRKVFVFDKIKNPFEISESHHLFAIENIDESRFEEYMSSVSSEDRSRYFRLSDKTAAVEFQKISHDNKDKNVSWIHFKDGTFRLEKSSRSISFVKKYIDTNNCFKFKLETLSDIGNKSVLVIGEPGMGKSTLLSRLATQSIERSPDVWVIKIDLNNHTGHFYKLFKSSKTFSDEKTVIEFITGTQDLSGFEKALFESYFRIENKLVILLDGFDEIAPHYRDIVVDLVKIIKSSDKIKVWITSRPHEKGFLEEQLDSLPYFLSEFTDEDQRHFFRMFWGKYVDKTDSRMKRLDTFVNRLINAISKSLCTTDDLLLISIPLQCKILADVYIDTFIEFYGNETDDTGIPEAVNILDLYNRFIEIKCKINIEEKRGTDITRPENTTFVDDEMKKITSRYKLLSLGVVFDEEDEKILLNKESKETIKISLLNIEEGLDKCGIVHSIKNGIPVFVHRTFAEYFAAMYLRDFISYSENKKKKRLAFVRNKLLEPKYAVVRRFFDRFTGTDDIFKHALNGDKEQLWKILENDPNAIHRTDEFGRNILHLIAGYDYAKDICEYLVEFGADTTRRDELFGMKPVEYAVALKVWGNVNELIVGNENNKVMLKSIKNKKELMLYAGEKGWTRLIKYLVEIGKMSVDTENGVGRSTLYFAASQGHVETCRYLIETGANIKCDSQYIYKFGYKSPFHIAFEKGFVEIVKLFIENDRDINEDICYKETLLHRAMESGKVEILRFLVDHGVNVNNVNEDGETPLHLVRNDTNIEVIDFLLERGANIEALDNRKRNPLMKYVEVGNVSVVRHLVEKGADIYYWTKYNHTIVHKTVSLGHLNILEILIAHDPNILKKIRFSETLLHFAMKYNNIETIKLLIKNGADVNGRNENEETPLHTAGWTTKTEIIDILLSHGANIDAMDRGGNIPLINYVKKNNLSIVQHLIKKGANLHHYSENGLTVLHHAAYRGNLDMVEMLIARDATIMEDANVIETVLHAAMKSCELKIIEVLIRHGANVNGRNENEETPLHITDWRSNTESIDILLNCGADIDATDRNGNTPLIKYVEINNLIIVQHLVKKGANLHHCDGNGLTVFHLAASAGNLNMVEMLIACDATIMEDANVIETVLHATMESCELKIIELLIKHGANVNGRNENGEVPLHIATEDTDVRIIDVLLKSGTNIDATSDDGSTPLIKYIEAGNFKVVEHLVCLGADVHYCPANNRTALHCAAAVGSLEMVERLIKCNQTLVKTIASANTLLHEAMKFGVTRIIKLLIDHGADVNGRNRKGETPLHISKAYTNINAIKLLLKHGADVEAKDNNGITPMTRLENLQHIEAVQLLRTFIDDGITRSEKNGRGAKKNKMIGWFNKFFLKDF